MVLQGWLVVFLFFSLNLQAEKPPHTQPELQPWINPSPNHIEKAQFCQLVEGQKPPKDPLSYPSYERNKLENFLLNDGLSGTMHAARAKMGQYILGVSTDSFLSFYVSLSPLPQVA